MKYYIKYSENWSEIISLSDELNPPDGYTQLIPLNPTVKFDLVEHRAKSIRLIFDNKGVVYWDIITPTDEILSNNVIDIPVSKIFLYDQGDDLSVSTSELQSEIKELFDKVFQGEVMDNLLKARDTFNLFLAQLDQAIPSTDKTCAIDED